MKKANFENNFNALNPVKIRNENNKDIEKQLKEIKYRKQTCLQVLNKEVEQIIERSNFDYEDYFCIPISMINSIYQYCQIPYKDNIEYFHVCVSNNNNVYKEIEKECTLVKSNLISPVKNIECQGGSSNTSSQMILQVSNNEPEEIPIKMKYFPYKVQTSFGVVFRADKNVYEGYLEEQYKKPQVEKQIDLSPSKTGSFKFSFLNTVQAFRLDLLQNPPYTHDIPHSQLRHLKVYYILREMIFEGLDYLHTKACCETALHNPDKIPSSPYSTGYKLPSLLFKNRQRIQKVSSFDRDREKEISSEQTFRNLEKRLKQLVLRVRRSRKEPQTSETRYFQQEMIKDPKIVYFTVSDQQTRQNMNKTYEQQVSLQVAPGVDLKDRQFLDKLTKASYFMKLNSRTQEFHQKWLEMRGFHLFWYDSQQDTVARGMGQIEEQPLIDDREENKTQIDQGIPKKESMKQSLRIRAENIFKKPPHNLAGRMFSVVLTNRSLSFKIDSTQAGPLWRKIIVNSIAYKTYLNSLIFQVRVLATFNKQQKNNQGYQDESIYIHAPLVQYFKQEDYSQLDLVNNAMAMQAASAVYGFNQQPKLYHYSKQIGRILSDSLLWHNKIKNLSLSNSKLTPYTIGQLFIAFKRRHVRLQKIDLSRTNLLTETINDFVIYLLCDSSFSLNELIFDNSYIGDQNMSILCQALTTRYTEFWNPDSSKLIKPEKPKISEVLPQKGLEGLSLLLKASNFIKKRQIQVAPPKLHLELIRTISLKNIGLSDQGLQEYLGTIEMILLIITSSLGLDKSIPPQNNSVYESASPLINKYTRITYSFLKMIKELCEDQGVLCRMEDIIKLIKMDLHIGSNDGSDQTLKMLGNLIEKYDCFNFIDISGMRQTTGIGLVKLTEQIMDSLNLEKLEIHQISIKSIEFIKLLENICENFSIIKVKLPLPYETEDFYEAIEKSKIIRIWNKHLEFSE